jgi:hypothetical protein
MLASPIMWLLSYHPPHPPHPVVHLVLFLLETAGLWAVFEKARQHGWAAIVPIYNLIVLMRVAGKPWWWVLLLLVPVVNLVIAFITGVAIAHRFGKSTLFGIGLVVLGPIFFPILGFGRATYRG